MNRAERRRLDKENIKGIKTRTQTVDDYIHIYTLSMALALDSENIEKEQALRIMSKIVENSQCMASGHINQQDVEQMCKDNYGLEFVDNTKKHKMYVRQDGTLTNL